ncbi:PIN domain-containing protein [Pontibacter beigongshangensis]|uniref:PIN domain-containing protein n=1 Tax=Pontibacter beigongshangensis TaxID=2574733 RepID=UPI001650CC28|nr:PIN domain-containing protein [Pontibacter beigongshangensis]
MKALLDTNIIINREANKASKQDIGILYKWLDKAKYTKYIHPITIQEIERNPNKATVEAFHVKMKSYEALPTTAPMASEVAAVSKKFDHSENDRIDTILLNEVFNERVDILISEDKKIHTKANALGISDNVYTINSFLEKIFAENPDLVEYKVLSVQQKYFAELDFSDEFFDSLKDDYPGFDKWFKKKANEIAYVTINKTNGKILSFLYIKKEGPDEVYSDIDPIFKPKKRLKVGTFKVVSNGVRLGERFLKIIFDNALVNKVEEIYVTIFDKRDEQNRLIALLEEWGFQLWGRKNEELVYVRDFTKKFNSQNPKETYPYISLGGNIFVVPIYPEYHTELIPDSILHTESKGDFIDDQPHRNAISKVYISRSWERNLQKGDIIIFYRTGGFYKSVVTTIGVVDNIYQSFDNVEDFIKKTRRRSVFTEVKLKEHWNYNPESRPFLVNFLYVYSFPQRINLKQLIDLGVFQDIEDAPRGFKRITQTQLNIILKATKTDESFIIH